MSNAWVESDDDALTASVLENIRLVYDPEIPVNVYDLGLIYKIVIREKTVAITMTLTNPACPSGSEIAESVKRSIELLKDIASVQVRVTFDPPYSSEMMSDAARLELGFM